MRDEVKRLVESVEVLFEAPLADAFAGTQPHGDGSAGIGQHAFDCGGELDDVADRVDAALNTIGDQIRLAANLIGEDDSAAGVHDFIDDQTPGFVLGRENEEGGEIEVTGQLGLVLKTAEADAVEAGGLLFERLALGAIADDDQIGSRLRAGTREHDAKRLDEVGAAFAWLQLGGEEDDRAIFLKVELRAEFCAGERRGGGVLRSKKSLSTA